MNKRLLAGIAALCTLAVIAAASLLVPMRREAARGQEAVTQIVPPHAPPRPAPAAPVAPPGAPQVDAVTYQPVTAQTAEEINKAVPLQAAGPAARPLVIAPDAPSRDRALHCLAQAVYYEAGTEGDAGQRAVAQVVLNRLRSAAFPNSVCGVIYQGSERSSGCQFTFTCDGSLRRTPTPAGWTRAMAVAGAALNGRVYAPVGHATHYHADYVVPYWAASMAKIRVIGLHDFYRWPGNWRPATYFTQSYANAEPDVPGMPGTAIATETATATSTVPDIPPKAAAHPKALIVDQKPAVLLTGDKPRLDPSLDRITVLRADLESEKLPAR